MKKMTNAELRAILMDDPRVLRVRIRRTGEVDILIDAERGDGGKAPWWMFKGWKDELKANN